MGLEPCDDGASPTALWGMGQELDEGLWAVVSPGVYWQPEPRVCWGQAGVVWADWPENKALFNLLPLSWD